MSEVIPTHEQQLVIDYPDSLVAIAKPGSGKTFVLARKIEQILTRLEGYNGVIAISYTNKASDELRRRVVSGGPATKASFFGTIDRFCYGEIIIPFLPHLWGQPDEVLAIHRLRDLTEEEQEAFADLTENQVSVQDIEEHLAPLKAWFKKGRLFLECSGALALYTLLHSLAGCRYIAARYTHIIIDEYQDSGLEQHELFLKIQSLGLTAIAVGDANQSIFGFSNKDSKYLLGLAKDANFKSFPITFNHRCHPSIINYSLRFIDENASLIAADELRVFYLSCPGTPAAIAKWIGGQFSAIIQKYGVKKPSEVAILVRGGATGALVDAALPLKHRYLVGHPLEEHFSLWARLFAQLLVYRFDEKHTAEEIIAATSSRLNDAENRRARKLLKSLRACADADLYDKMEEIAALLLPNARKQEPIDLLRSSNTSGLQRHFGKADDDEVQVMSLHKSKGLEFDVVFHLDLYEWTFPAKRPGPDDDFDHPVYPSWEQDSNLHYVGITRARKACFLCSSTRRFNSSGQEKAGNPSEFLFLNDLAALRLPV
jgi:DNA helicase-2/ATP-dependent DNA helicase PcrA